MSSEEKIIAATVAIIAGCFLSVVACSWHTTDLSADVVLACAKQQVKCPGIGVVRVGE